MTNGKILLLIAHHGFQPLEYGDTKEELEKASLEVITGSEKKGIAVSAGNFLQTQVDVAISDIKIEDYDGLYLIGGPGALECLDNEKVYDLLKQWQKTNKPFGAICISTRILAKAGMLQGKTATGWNGDNELPKILQKYGATYSMNDVCRDGNIITAAGPMAAHEFGKKIVENFSF